MLLKWFVDVMRGIGVVTIILRVAISPQFLYKCSENVSVANIAFDVGAYLTLGASVVPWHALIKNEKRKYCTDKRCSCPCSVRPLTAVYGALLGLSAVYVALMVVRWFHGLGSLSGCSGCPSVSQTNFTDSSVDCTATSSDFFYNGLNYCSDVFQTLCYPAPAATKGNLVGVDSNVAHCPLLGCNVQLLPLQFVSYWWTVAAFAVNIALCVVSLLKWKEIQKEEAAASRKIAEVSGGEADGAATVAGANAGRDAGEEDLGEGDPGLGDSEQGAQGKGEALPRVDLFRPLPLRGTNLTLPRRRIKVRPLPVV